MMAEPAGPSEAAWAAATTLHVDRATAAVLVALRAARVRAVLLKGPTIARWLYGGGQLRQYLDTDLLVRSCHVAVAGEVLAEMGYAPDFDDDRMPAWWRRHASTWIDTGRGSAVDLHRTLQGIRVDHDVAWEVLTAQTDTLEVGGVPAEALAIPARALHVALVAAHDGPSGRAGADLLQALQRVSNRDWAAAVALAAELEATDSLAVGLSQVPEGAALAVRLGLQGQQSVQTALRSFRGSNEALTVERIARASGARARADIVRAKLFPPATYMRFWSPFARRGRLALAVAYAYRVLWVTRRSLPASAAWCRARRRLGQRTDIRRRRDRS